MGKEDHISRRLFFSLTTSEVLGRTIQSTLSAKPVRAGEKNPHSEDYYATVTPGPVREPTPTLIPLTPTAQSTKEPLSDAMSADTLLPPCYLGVCGKDIEETTKSVKSGIENSGTPPLPLIETDKTNKKWLDEAERGERHVLPNALVTGIVRLPGEIYYAVVAGEDAKGNYDSAAGFLSASDCLFDVLRSHGDLEEPKNGVWMVNKRMTLDGVMRFSYALGMPVPVMNLKAVTYEGETMQCAPNYTLASLNGLGGVVEQIALRVVRESSGFIHDAVDAAQEGWKAGGN